MLQLQDSINSTHLIKSTTSLSNRYRKKSKTENEEYSVTLSNVISKNKIFRHFEGSSGQNKHLLRQFIECNAF